MCTSSTLSPSASPAVTWLQHFTVLEDKQETQHLFLRMQKQRLQTVFLPLQVQHGSKVHLLANTSKEIGAWLNALPVASCDLCMDEETICVGVGLQLGALLCFPYQCHYCGGEVDCFGTHGLSCHWSEGHFFHLAAINDTIYRSMHSVNVPSHLEPLALYQSDDSHPDGISIIPWECGKHLLWDATTPGMFAPSHRSVAVRGVGEVALQVEHLKHSKYSALEAKFNFVPVVVETSRVFDPEAHEFLHKLRLCMA